MKKVKAIDFAPLLKTMDGRESVETGKQSFLEAVNLSTLEEALSSDDEKIANAASVITKIEADAEVIYTTNAAFYAQFSTLVETAASLTARVEALEAKTK